MYNQFQVEFPVIGMFRKKLREWTSTSGLKMNENRNLLGKHDISVTPDPLPLEFVYRKKF